MNRTPDLSHLSANEKKIIEAVISRQKAEEKLQSPSNDYLSPSVVSSRSRRSQSSESGVFCEICQSTKFVGQQSSRQCSVCEKIFCASCGIRLKSHYYLCNQCREKQEHYFSSKNNISKQYSSDYILSQTHEEHPYGANPKRVLPKLNNVEADVSSPDFIATLDPKKRLLPIVRPDARSINILRDFQYHSLEERELGNESTLKDSGIDTASSSTILNMISPEQFQKPVTYWRMNESRTEQIGYIYLKNNLCEQRTINHTELCNALGLHLRNNEITRVLPGSIADTYGQLRVGDQIIEWNGEKLTHDIGQMLANISFHSPQIHLIVKRSIRQPVVLKTEMSQENPLILNPIQLQLSIQYDQKDLHVMIYGARSIPVEQGLLACQLSLEYERDTSLREEKCTKAQECFDGVCTWKQHVIFFDLETIDHFVLWIKLINLEHNQEILGEMKFHKLDFPNKSDWYSFSNDLPSNRTVDIQSTTNNPKRKLPDIPTSQVHANRVKVSQELYEKATQLKLRLHMQSTNEKPLLVQHSFDQADSIDRQTNSNALLSSSKVSLTSNLKEKARLPLIRDKNAPNSITARRASTIGPNALTMEPKLRKSLKKRYSSETPDGEDVDSDESEFRSTPKLTPATKSLHRRSNDHFHGHDEIQLNEEELRQMAMRTHETFNSQTTPNSAMKTSCPIVVPTDKNIKVDQRNDGTVSDSILSTQSEPSRKRRPSMSSKALVILGLSKKANSSSSLGFNKRSGFQRSEEIGVQPHLRNRALERQTSKENETPTSAPVNSSSQSPFNTHLQRDQFHSMPLDIKLWSGALKLPHEHQFTEFIEGLGAGQLVGRQVLASPCHGEIQIGLRDRQGLLEVEIVRARNLIQKALYRSPPAPYVKVYLLDGKTCIEKQRTRTTRRTLDPLIQQTLVFKEYFREKILQVSIWGDYGKLDRKSFLGVCQIALAEVKLNSSQQILGWYKLFSANSLMNNYTIVQQSLKNKYSNSTIDRS